MKLQRDLSGERLEVLLAPYHERDGLVKKLKALEPEFRQAEETAKAERRAVSKRGHALRIRTETPGPKN